MLSNPTKFCFVIKDAGKGILFKMIDGQWSLGVPSSLDGSFKSLRINSFVSENPGQERKGLWGICINGRGWKTNKFIHVEEAINATQKQEAKRSENERYKKEDRMWGKGRHNRPPRGKDNKRLGKKMNNVGSHKREREGKNN